MTVRLGVIMDPISGIHYQKDTTLALCWAAQDAGWELLYMEQQDLYLDGGEAWSSMRPLKVFRSPDRWFELGAPTNEPLSSMDVLLMRKDPPFDMNYIYTTYMLEVAAQSGVLVINNPSSLRDCNEKLFATRFPRCCAPSLVSSSITAIREFAHTHGDIVLKPLDGMGGQGVFKVVAGDPNLGVIVETLSGTNHRPLMAQRYLPEIRDGDKRILMVNGDPAPYCLARIPRPGEARGNLAAGGKGEVRPLTARDRWICSEVGPELRARGLLFVGLDVIGDYLTEINVTSPTCLREIESATSLRIADDLIRVIATQLTSNRRGNQG